MQCGIKLFEMQNKQQFNGIGKCQVKWVLVLGLDFLPSCVRNNFPQFFLYRVNIAMSPTIMIVYSTNNRTIDLIDYDNFWTTESNVLESTVFFSLWNGLNHSVIEWAWSYDQMTTSCVYVTTWKKIDKIKNWNVWMEKEPIISETKSKAFKIIGLIFF